MIRYVTTFLLFLSLILYLFAFKVLSRLMQIGIYLMNKFRNLLHHIFTFST